MFTMKQGLIGLGIAALMSLLIYAVYYAISTNNSNNDIFKAKPSITFGEYETDGQWPVPTRYTASIAEGPKGNTVTVFSTTRSNPRFGVSPAGTVVQWYRAVAPLYTWEKHTMERRTDGSYVDTDVVPIPTPRVPSGSGQFQSKWAAEAGDQPAWMVPTWYRARYEVGEAAGPWSQPSEVFESGVYTNPSLRVESFPPMEVQWQRSVGSLGAWVGHVMTRRGDNTFVDVGEVEIPTPPAPTGNGRYEGKWNAQASEQIVPWRLPSEYRVRYVLGEVAGPWSAASEEFVSDVYTTPSLRAEPLYPFEIEWEACGSFITLPNTNSQAAELDMTVDGQNSFGIHIPFQAVWSPGSTDLVMPVVNFANIWNASTYGMIDPWPMDVLPDGSLELTLNRRGVSGDVWLSTTTPNRNQWWPLMGFDELGTWQLGEPIIADTPAGTVGCMSKIGSTTFVDEGNPFK